MKTWWSWGETTPPPATAEGKESLARPLVSTPNNHIPSKITQTGPLNEKEQKDNHPLRSCIEDYFKVVKKNVADQTPKIVTYFLVDRLTGSDLLNYLTKNLFKDALMADLLKESDEVSIRRGAAKSKIKCLTAAKAVLNKVLQN